jgi:hypothetical protein
MEGTHMLMRTVPRIVLAVCLAAGWMTALSSGAFADCRCLDNGGEPGPGACPCNVGECYQRCVAALCPGAPNCTLACSLRCACNDAPPECPSHEDPGATPTPIVACAGDCDGDGRVGIDELLRAVRIAMHSAPLSACSSLDTDGDELVSISELVGAVGSALHGCPGAAI